MSPQLTWRKAIDKVLGCSSGPLHYREITDRIIAEGYRTSLGATPADSVNSEIYSSIKRDGENSPYVRVAKGTFMLRIGKGNVAAGRKLSMTLRHPLVLISEQFHLRILRLINPNSVRQNRRSWNPIHKAFRIGAVSTFQHLIALSPHFMRFT